jgi:hypothetical protein
MKLKTRALTFFLSALFALTTGQLLAQRAKAPAKPNTPAVKDYFPLRVGDSWKYQMVEEEAEYTLKVLSAEKQADGTMLYLLERLEGTEIHEWYSKTNGWVLMHKQSYTQQETFVEHKPPRQVLKNPLVVGEKWRWSGKTITQNNVTETNEVIGLETVKVPAGTFRAMKVVSQVRDTDSGVTRTYWYAEGVGLVKWMTEGGQIKYSWELVDYSFKRPSTKR